MREAGRILRPERSDTLPGLLKDLRGLAALDRSSIPGLPAKNVAARDQTAGNLAEDQNRFLQRRTIKARPASVWKQGLLRFWRNPLVTCLMAALVLAFLAGLVVATSAATDERNDIRTNTGIAPPSARSAATPRR